MSDIEGRPYADLPVPKKGDRVGYQELDGSVYVGTVTNTHTDKDGITTTTLDGPSITQEIAAEVEAQQAEWLSYGGHAVAAEIFRILEDLNLTIVRTTDVEYAVKHPVNGEPRFARETLKLCRATAEEHDTTVLHRHVGPWTDGEPA